MIFNSLISKVILSIVLLSAVPIIFGINSCNKQRVYNKELIKNKEIIESREADKLIEIDRFERKEKEELKKVFSTPPLLEDEAEEEGGLSEEDRDELRQKLFDGFLSL